MSEELKFPCRPRGPALPRSKKLKIGDLVTCEDVGVHSGDVTHHRGSIESWQRFRAPGGKSWLFVKVLEFKREVVRKGKRG